MKTFRLPMAAVIAAGMMIATTAHAQQTTSPIAAGAWIISGTAGIASSHDNATDETRTSIRLSPTGLMFVRPRLAIGGSVPLYYASASAGHTSGYGIGPSARYYFGDMTGKLFPFLSASVLPQWQNSHASTSVGGVPFTSDGTSRSLAIDGSAGLTRLVASHVGVTGEAYYTHVEATDDNGPISQTRHSYDLGLRFGLTVFVH